MIEDERYITFLKRVIACISYGDYYSVKELSQLELEKMQKQIEEKKEKNKIFENFSKLRYTKNDSE